jgi:hypothetical protein
MQETIYLFLPVAIFLNAALLALSLRLTLSPVKNKKD